MERDLEPDYEKLRTTSFFFLRFYLFIHERHRHTHREAETQAEGEAPSMLEARCGTQSRDHTLNP